MNQVCTSEVFQDNLFQSNQSDFNSLTDSSENTQENSLDDEAEYDESYNNYDEDEQDSDEEYPCVYYNLKTSPKQDNSKELESLKQRQEKIQQKKNEQRVLQQILHIQDELPHQRVTIQKVKTLAPYAAGVKGGCYVPERNLIFIILQESKNVVIFSSLSFREVKRLKFTKPIRVVRYSKKYERVFFGGEDFCVETFNLNTFKMEFQSDFKRGWHVDEIAYLKKKHAIAAATVIGYLHILSKSLTLMYQINLQTSAPVREVLRLGSNFVLVALESYNKKNLYLCNLKTQKAQLCKDIVVSSASCIEVTKGALKTVTCLASVPERLFAKYLLAQLALDVKNEQLITYKIDSMATPYSGLKRLSNSDYFIARSSITRTVLMKISGEEFQPIKTIIRTDCNIYSAQISMFYWLNQVPAIIGPDSTGKICVYSVRTEKESKALKNE